MRSERKQKQCEEERSSANLQRGLDFEGDAALGLHGYGEDDEADRGARDEAQSEGAGLEGREARVHENQLLGRQG